MKEEKISINFMGKNDWGRNTRFRVWEKDFKREKPEETITQNFRIWTDLIVPP